MNTRCIRLIKTIHNGDSHANFGVVYIIYTTSFGVHIKKLIFTHRQHVVYKTHGKVRSILKASDQITKIEIKDIDEIKGKGIYKIRCNLIPSRYKLEIRFLRTDKEILYSYQLFTDKPIIRWGNAPHYPKMKTYPHHFHTKDGNIVESKLKGNIIEDLQEVLFAIKNALKERKY